MATKPRVLIIDDTELADNSDNWPSKFEVTRIVGAQRLLPGQIEGICPDGSLVLLKLADFATVTMVPNHVQGPVTVDELEAHIKDSGVSYAPIGCPDGRNSRGGTPYTPPSARWVIKVKVPPTPEQREILRNLGVAVDTSGSDTLFLATMSKRDADWLRAQPWVKHVEREVFHRPQ